MRDAIAVLNAGSSSIKFSLFAQAGDDLELTVRGQAEGLQTAPRFVAKSAAATRWPRTPGPKARRSATPPRSSTSWPSCASRRRA